LVVSCLAALGPRRPGRRASWTVAWAALVGAVTDDRMPA